MTNTHRRTFIKQIGLGAAGLGMVSTFPGCASPRGKTHGGLPRSTPEAQGVSSEAILNFVNAAASSKHELHSFMMVRNGHVIAEGWWKPYRADANHMLYSLSKSFTSTAVGFAVTDGELHLDDPVVSFFPEELPPLYDAQPNLVSLQVKHLLTMSVGRAKDSVPVMAKDQDWVRTFLAAPIQNPPGSVFLYDSTATYMLSAIVQKVTGQKVIDYLKPRLFEPLEIRGMTWETSPQGINTGGWGLAVRTEALAKFGQLYLQNGMWNGKQILPASWVQEATTFKIQQPPGAGQDLEKLKISSDWHQGYCYQFWRCRHNAFRGDGAYGQFMVVLPEQQTVIAITAQTSDMQGELNLVWDHLLPGIKDSTTPADEPANTKLQRRLSSLALPVEDGWASSPLASKLSGKTFHIAPNDLKIQSISFQWPRQSMGPEFDTIGHRASSRLSADNISVCRLKSDKGHSSIECGLGVWLNGTCDVPGTPPKISVGDLPPVKIAASAAWKDRNTFQMIWRYYETPHHDVVTCRFGERDVTVEFKNGIPGHKETRPVLHGEIA